MFKVGPTAVARSAVDRTQPIISGGGGNAEELSVVVKIIWGT